MPLGLCDAVLPCKGSWLHEQGVKLREQGVLEQLLDAEVFSNLCRDSLEVEQLLLLLLKVSLHHLKVFLLERLLPGLVLDLLELEPEEVPHEVVSVNSRVTG